LKKKIGNLMGAMGGSMGGSLGGAMNMNNMSGGGGGGPPGLSEAEIVELIERHTIKISDSVEDTNKMVEKNILDLDGKMATAEIKLKEGIADIRLEA
jgi:hypothetical protein